MHTTYTIVRYLVACVALGVISGCATGTQSAVPPPAAPETATSGAPSASSTAGASITTGNALAAALDKTRSATVYRIAFSYETGSIVGGQTQTQPYVAFDGEVSGDANHITYHGGAFTEMLGGGTRVEMVSIGNKTYLRGSDFFGAADPAHWYYLPDSAITKPPFNVQDILQLTGSDMSQAQPSGGSSLDGQECQAWHMDLQAQATPLIDLATTPDTKDSFSIVDSAAAQFTTCADGYIHAMQWNVISHGTADTVDKATISITAHLFDFNAANIVISAPGDAIEMK